ncbi:MAG: hypothetical protein JHD15_07060 [Phenylobacterium sp.]|uniref:hypothetical protein n=1 Tax=Phenylobacterium sp. TaxID=1871053 RepID=UPI001A18EC9C|nr:hypothetical protein [Phenylobacterium sp.]MBJ7410112.1 hypothetical protein [Phenylobacterium sp.]
MTLDGFKGMVADLARPFSILVTSLSAAVTPVIIVIRVAPDRLDLIGAAALVGAHFAGLGALYWGKSWEQAKVAGQNAEVEKVRATANPPPAEALKPAEPEHSLEDPA